MHTRFHDAVECALLSLRQGGQKAAIYYRQSTMGAVRDVLGEFTAYYHENLQNYLAHAHTRPSRTGGYRLVQ